jgi:hypothetical protein
VESASYDIGLTITDDVYRTIIKKATPGQRVAAGVQGVLNFGLGELKGGAIGIGGGILGVGGVPETEGASLVVVAPVVLYGVTSSQGQALGALGQMYTAFSGYRTSS